MSEQQLHLLAQEIIETLTISEQAEPHLLKILSHLTEYNDHTGALVIVTVMTGDRTLVNVAKTIYKEREEYRGLSNTAHLIAYELRIIVEDIYPETYKQVRESL